MGGGKFSEFIFDEWETKSLCASLFHTSTRECGHDAKQVKALMALPQPGTIMHRAMELCATPHASADIDANEHVKYVRLPHPDYQNVKNVCWYEWYVQQLPADCILAAHEFVLFGRLALLHSIAYICIYIYM